MNIKMKKIKSALLVGSFLIIQPGMTMEPTPDIEQPQRIFNFDEVVNEDLLLMAKLARASYKSGDELKTIREDLVAKGMVLLEEMDDHSVDFRAQAWLNAYTMDITISFRGTVPTSPQNLLSDIAIAKYAAANQKIAPLEYLCNHAQTTWSNFTKDNTDISENDNDYNTILETLKNNPNLIKTAGYSIVAATGLGLSTTGVVVVGAGIFCGITMAPLAAATAVSTPLFAAVYSAISLAQSGSLPLNKDEENLKKSCDLGFQFLEKIKNAFPEANIRVTGHSLGGFNADVVGGANDLPTITFNAPGGADHFLKVNYPSKLYHDKQTTKYVRFNDIVGQVGSPSKNTVCLPDFNKTSYFQKSNGMNMDCGFSLSLSSYAKYALKNHAIDSWINDFKHENINLIWKKLALMKFANEFDPISNFSEFTKDLIHYIGFLHIYTHHEYTQNLLLTKD